MKSKLKANTKILLVNPPLANLTQPCVSIPSLSAYLKTNEFHSFDVYDLNIEYADWLLNRNRLKYYYDRVLKWFVHNEDHFGNVCLNNYETNLWRKVADEEKYISEIKNVERSKKVLRGNRFYKEAEYIWATSTIDSLMDLMAVTMFPLVCDARGQVVYHCCHDLYNFDGLSKAVDEFESIAINPFDDFIQQVFIPRIAKSSVDCLAISCTYDSQLFFTVLVAKIIKTHFPHIRTLVGGSFVSKILEHGVKRKECFLPYVDDVIIGDGEKPLLAYSKAIDCRRSINSLEIPNLIQCDNKYKPQQMIEWEVKNLNDLPCPSYDGLDLKLYLSPHPVLSIIPTRGCYWSRCAFCKYGFGCTDGSRRATSPYRERDVNLLVRDLIQLKRKHKTKYFYFSSDAVAPSYLLRLSDMLVKKNISVCYALDLRLEKSYLSSEVIRRLYRGGMRGVYVGLESASSKVLKLMEKGVDAIDISPIFKNLSIAGISVRPMWFLGFPGEKRKEVLETVKFLIDHKKHCYVTSSVSTFKLLRGSKVHRYPRKYGVRIPRSGHRTYGGELVDCLNSGSSSLARSVREATKLLKENFPPPKPPWLFSIYPAHILILTGFGGKKLVDKYLRRMCNGHNPA